MAVWVLLAVAILVLLAYVAWELRWYLSTLRRTFRGDAANGTAEPVGRELAGTGHRH
jgi:hypothetical protein